MKKSMAILILFLVGTLFSVAAHPVTVKNHYATENAVSKTTNDVVINIIPSMEAVIDYVASDNVYFVVAPQSFAFVGYAKKHSFVNYSRVNINSQKAYTLNLKRKNTFTESCRIRKLTSRPLICSVD